MRKCDPVSLEAVNRNEPSTRDEFGPMLFRLARDLKFAEAGRCLSQGRGPEYTGRHRRKPQDFAEAFNLWYFLALPRRYVRWEKAWEWFCEMFRRAKTAPRTWLHRIARKVMCVWWKGAERRITGILGAVARTNRTLHLSGRVASELTGVPARTAARVLNRLVAAGTIRVISEGKPHRTRRIATTYDLSPLVAVRDHVETSKKRPFYHYDAGIMVYPPQPHDPADGPPEGYGSPVCATNEPDPTVNAPDALSGAGEGPPGG